MKRLTELLPPSLIRWFGRLQYKVPLLRPLIQRASKKIRVQDSTIRHGIGKGLIFNPHGGNPGYALGTSGTEEQNALQMFLSDGSVFYNIGANKGFYAILGARLVGSGGHVYAIEPFPESTQAVRYNAEINKFSNVDVLELALSDHVGQGDFLLTGNSVEFKLATSRTANTDRGVPTIEVEVDMLDNLIRKRALRPPTFVMIDVEGSEIEVLKGMKNTISSHRPAILCEIHWLNKEVDTFVSDFLRPNRYNVSQLNGDAFPSAPERYHALFVPEEHPVQASSL